MPVIQNQILFHPIISCIQKVNLYEEKNMFYLIGSNNTTSWFRVIKIDRTDPRELTVVDDGVKYSIAEINRLVEKIEIAHRSRHTHRAGPSAKIYSAYGIVGFVKFTEGYYIILVTKRQQVAIIGHHMIYKIKDTCFVYIPQDVGRSNSPVEQRYIKLFQSIDLSSNFYFSYSYDLTHTLQHNLTPPSDFPLDAFQVSPASEVDQKEMNYTKQRELHESLHFGVRYKPNNRFVWNWYLLKPVMNVLHPDWLIYMVHGFVDQSNINVFGRSFYVSLIARRSRKYAGTRFLKRGANFEGDVANEVETEQMVHDTSVASFVQGRYTSFVQMRGSVPGHWSQDVSKMVPKPQISIDLSDPFGETSGKHFNQLLRRYGAPIIILNLVKKRETKRQESVLSEELIRNVRYLNQFLPPKYHIRYTSFDMARMNKTKDINVMQRLADIACACVLKTGIFVSKPIRTIGNESSESILGPRYQRGVVRVNCVDCLDRTNTAQFAVGRWALGAQLCALGVLRVPTLEFDTDCVRILEALYEDHGDTLALQYGGSQLVHRIETYRKTAPWTSQGNDIMQTLSRYYSNTFSDADKQNAINLFLGIFRPVEKGLHIWECLSDYYLHQSQSVRIQEKRTRPYTQWWDPEILPFLPRPYEDVAKLSWEILALRPDDEAVDGYVDYHRPYEVTILKETLAFKISHSVRDFMPNFTTDFSPFAVRVRPGRLREETGKSGIKNPSLTGQSSTSSTASSGTSSCEVSEDSLSDDDLDAQTESRGSRQEDAESGALLFHTLFPSMTQVYGMQPQEPSKDDLILYKKYQKMYKYSIETSKPSFSKKTSLILSGSSRIPNETDYCCRAPIVSTKSMAKYQQYILRNFEGASSPSKTDLDIYKKYVSVH